MPAGSKTDPLAGQGQANQRLCDNIFQKEKQQLERAFAAGERSEKIAPSSYTNSLAVIDWKSEEAPTVDEVAGRLRQYEESLSSSLVSAVEKLSQEVRQLKEDISYSPPAQTRISAVRSKHSSALERGYRAYTPQGILQFYLRNHGEDMRKWDGKPTSTLWARVRELQGKTVIKKDRVKGLIALMILLKGLLSPFCKR
ncbi:ubiquitin carboxyl-terminal hydrolase 4 [Grus japonensis]|uniref:Ubiquitin carboxyl-terminal hydrolase 4 n=1 Tax=Grus japonensis TaxID=30415 RepID=A0ABC9YHW2_GRUJA